MDLAPLPLIAVKDRLELSSRRVHFEPSKCDTTPSSPATQTSSLALPHTAPRSSSVSVDVHCEPSQWRSVPDSPTAHTSLAAKPHKLLGRSPVALMLTLVQLLP